MDNQSLNNLEEKEINLREELDKYLRYWPWFIIGGVVSITLGFMYLKLTVPIYNTVASVIIKDEEGAASGIGSELATFDDLGLLGGMSTSSIENEIGLFRSRRMMMNTVSALNLNISYFDTQGLKTDELYLNTPFLVEVISVDNRRLLKAQENDENEFIISFDSDKSLRIEIPANGRNLTIAPGKLLSLPWGSFVIKDNRAALVDLEEAKTNVLVRVASIEDVADYYKKEVKVELTDDNATLLQFTLESTAPQKARDILDQLIFEYNKEAIQDKNEVALSTARFIDERLTIINEELDTVEVGIEEFKEDNSLTDIEAEGKLILENASDYRKKEQEINTQRTIAQSLLKYLIDDDFGNQPLPINIGLEGESVNAQISRYNNLILERNRIRVGATELNPIVSRLNLQIEQLKEAIITGIRRQVANLDIALKDLNQQSRLIGDEIASVPSKERRFRDISRQQNIKEALYIFLLQRREENSLSLAATAPKAKIVDSAYTLKEAIFPKANIIIAAALLLGFGIPFIVIYIRRLLNNKIERREDIEKVTKSIPIIGELPRISKGESDLIEENDRSVLAESFRIMTTNLQYLLVNARNEAKGYCIYTTSTVKGEGKTFTSINLAMTLANTGKKVVIIGADLRNPQLQRYDAESKNFLGVSDYLVNDDHQLHSLINDSKFHPNLKLFLSGSIPPNPSELLRQKKFGTMLDELREQFDYVIVDTAPSMLVTDTFLISKFADLIIYVTRAGYTEKKLLNFAIDAQNDGKLHDIGFVINDVKTANFGYGNKYGYAYGQSKPSLWERFKKSF